MPLTPPLRVLLDLDGVFCNFNAGLAKQLVETTKHHLVPADYVPDTWHWPESLGYSKREIGRTWDDINADPRWWLRLEAYPNTQAALTWISQQVALQRIVVIFGTARPSPNAHWQSVEWLKMHGTLDPQVIVTGLKGRLAALIEAHVGIDDNIGNAEKLANTLSSAAIYTQPWNEDATWRGTAPTRLESLGELTGYIDAQADALAQASR